MSKMEIIERRLRIDNNLPDNFHFYRWECFPKSADPIYYEFEGGECRTVTKGKRKGRPDYKSASSRRTFVVVVEEGEQWCVDYEAETGLCRDCMGRKQTVARVSVKEGTTYRDCRRCGATGKANHERPGR